MAQPILDPECALKLAMPPAALIHSNKIPSCALKAFAFVALGLDPGGTA